jgi:hypothetical protein
VIMTLLPAAEGVGQAHPFAASCRLIKPGAPSRRPRRRRQRSSQSCDSRNMVPKFSIAT